MTGSFDMVSPVEQMRAVHDALEFLRETQPLWDAIQRAKQTLDQIKEKGGEIDGSRE